VGSVVLVADETVAARCDVVYGLFGARAGAGWVFAAECDTLAVGSVVALQLPVGGGQAAVDILGRVTSLVPPRQIVIALDQPWRGQLRICLERKGAESTRVSVRAEIDERGVEWLLRRRGWPACQPADDGDYRIGLLTSKSGPGAVFAVACENLAVMAVDELNADGGLHGRRVRLLVSDDATDPATGAAEARRLVRAGCRVVLASVTSATFGAVQRAIGECGVPLVHSVLNEGGGGPGHVFRWGERPADQLAVAAGPLMRTSGARQWFLVGDDYSSCQRWWARTRLPSSGSASPWGCAPAAGRCRWCWTNRRESESATGPRPDSGPPSATTSSCLPRKTGRSWRATARRSDRGPRPSRPCRSQPIALCTSMAPRCDRCGRTIRDRWWPRCSGSVRSCREEA